ncbi:TIGR03086 family metal-binding protein [Microlunatus soli]|uniref:TIGR03086 family protein n=1 Tax=Microlunatus soli TaxID=630515 RepID=A0A1H1V0Y7_9ACTN|nr:TIGR03086 family metal-binding protein [Microlunatus soli]SDS78447.1 TIGR03086 family protein [Microlunatus soli]
MTYTSTDPRRQICAALDQTQRQVDAVHPSQLALPTPCAEFDLKMLLAHLVAVLRKLTLVGDGRDMTLVTDPANDVVEECADVFRSARSEFDQVWAADGKLGEDFALVWGTMTRNELLDAYTHEFTVHAWDLAQVTGRRVELDPVLAHAALD